MDERTIRLDIEATLKNRNVLFQRKNFLYWYKRLYERLLGTKESVSGLRILEVGSGTSPLKHFYPTVLTSDIMPLDYVDYVFDAHDIDGLSKIENESLDVITLTNVLHHMQDPISFLSRARNKLRTGGRVIMVEPYFSNLSKLIYLYLHHEPTNFDVDVPCLSEVTGPLSSANIVIPYMIFWGKKNWISQVLKYYTIDESKTFYYTGISYMITGGISHNIVMPHWLYKGIWKIDNWLANSFHRKIAAFFSITLVKK